MTGMPEELVFPMPVTSVFASGFPQRWSGWSTVIAQPVALPVSNPPSAVTAISRCTRLGLFLCCVFYWACPRLCPRNPNNDVESVYSAGVDADTVGVRHLMCASAGVALSR